MGNKLGCHQVRFNRSQSIRPSDHQDLQESMIETLAVPKLSHLHVLRHEHAKLIESSTVQFGNVCLRLVNIISHTSQIFPSMVGTYLSMSCYLRQELRKKYSNSDFHIIIADNDSVHFAIGDGEQFAVIQQEEYRILIFSMKRQKKIDTKTKALNGRRKLLWKSIVIEQM